MHLSRNALVWSVCGVVMVVWWKLVRALWLGRVRQRCMITSHPVVFITDVVPIYNFIAVETQCKCNPRNSLVEKHSETHIRKEHFRMDALNAAILCRVWLLNACVWVAFEYFGHSQNSIAWQKPCKKCTKSCWSNILPTHCFPTACMRCP